MAFQRVCPHNSGHEKRMGYHCHDGKHLLSPFDWERFMDFADAHLKVRQAK